MTRAFVWWAALATVLLWWAPSFAAAAGALVLGRLRFRLALGLGRALMMVGCPGAAARVYGAEMARAERRMRAVRRRRP